MLCIIKNTGTMFATVMKNPIHYELTKTKKITT